MDSGWSVKKLIREIMLSRAYQLSQRAQRRELRRRSGQHARLADESPPARCRGDSRLGAARQRQPRPEAARTARRRRSITAARSAAGPGPTACSRKSRYRSAYLPIVRGMVPEFLSLFDVADPELVTGQRDVTTDRPAGPLHDEQPRRARAVRSDWPSSCSTTAGWPTTRPASTTPSA